MRHLPEKIAPFPPPRHKVLDRRVNAAMTESAMARRAGAFLPGSLQQSLNEICLGEGWSCAGVWIQKAIFLEAKRGVHVA
jgi:hypothetical protein